MLFEEVFALVNKTDFKCPHPQFGKNLAKAPEASGWFRSIFVDVETARGVWRLKLETASEAKLEIVLTTWKDAAKLTADEIFAAAIFDLTAARRGERIFRAAH